MNITHRKSFNASSVLQRWLVATLFLSLLGGCETVSRDSIDLHCDKLLADTNTKERAYEARLEMARLNCGVRELAQPGSEDFEFYRSTALARAIEAAARHRIADQRIVPILEEYCRITSRQKASEYYDRLAPKQRPRILPGDSRCTLAKISLIHTFGNYIPGLPTISSAELKRQYYANPTGPSAQLYLKTLQSSGNRREAAAVQQFQDIIMKKVEAKLASNLEGTAVSLEQWWEKMQARKQLLELAWNATKRLGFTGYDNFFREAIAKLQLLTLDGPDWN